MAEDFSTDYLGDIKDEVVLMVDGKELTLVKSYEVSQSVMTQPSAFVFETMNDLRIDPNTPFQLKVGPTIQFSGRTDGYTISQDAYATSLSVRGRDTLAPLQDSFIQVDRAFPQTTYADLVKAAMVAVGMDPGLLVYSNVDNRTIKSGVSQPQGGSVVDVTNEGTRQEQQLTARVGERWYHLIKRELDRAGLFLWATADGHLCLSRPDGNQAPKYRIARRRDKLSNLVNVEHVHFKNETTHRFSEALVYGRYGGKKYGRAKAIGRFEDAEMIGLGYKRAFVVHDVDLSDDKQASFYASQKLAEFRREGWSLQYTVAGHTVPALEGKGRAVWCTDTVVDVEDDELGFYGPLWIESVTFKRDTSGTTTTLTLMRLDDLLFGRTD